MHTLEADYMEGLRLFYLSRYDEALEMLTRTAEAGEMKSQHFLALMYENGNGVERDPARAAYWYGKTAEQGDVEAQLSYSMICALGRGVEEDIGAACHWAVRSLHQGNLKAEQALRLIRTKAGECAAAAVEAFRAAHAAGDETRAAAELERAAECGDADAQYAFAQLLYEGRGVAENRGEAMLWMRDAAQAGHAGALRCCEEWMQPETDMEAAG
ncbi:MAG: sel1 repeat family protein [Oscillospiraceae bacterium]|nr:sel1 repeat family protein [Oscillospiraceae bacterium]